VRVGIDVIPQPKSNPKKPKESPHLSQNQGIKHSQQVNSPTVE